jgi:hypothetical protein
VRAYLSLQVPGKGRTFTAATASGYSNDGTTARWSGTGSWQGQAGYSYTFVVTRADTKKGSAPSTVDLTITAPGGTQVWRTPSTSPFQGGSVMLRR